MNKTPETLKNIKARLNLSDAGLADYLGVTVHAVRKWCAGTRAPESSALRLIDVLAIVETMAPDVHAVLVPAVAVAAGPAAAPKRHGRPRRAAPAAPVAATPEA
jgi:transcriptional regulator with XRE-family HTH domain